MASDEIQKLHPDPDVSCTLNKLDHVLADWLRNTGEETTVIVIPHSRSTPTHVSVGGERKEVITIVAAAEHAMRLRGGE